ncbi:MAG: toxin [Planctomycetota bacterium]|nr:toxin [Planctomycetota bacterium]
MHTAATRILIVGNSGAGKTTFAKQLSKQREIPYIELDELYWGPNWTPHPAEQFSRDVSAVAERETWIVDGNYQPVRSILWPRAQLVIWLKYSRLTVMSRLLRRAIRRSINKTELWSGNRETLTLTFASRESVLRWSWVNHAGYQKLYRTLQKGNEFPHLAWVEFVRPRQAEEYLHSLTRQD